MWIGAVDNSISSPGVVKFLLDEKFNIIDKKYIGFAPTSAKKPKKTPPINIIRYFNAGHDRIQQMIDFSDIIVDFLKECSYVGIENYAFAAKGDITGLAEITGMVKRKLFLNNVKVRLYSPGTIKMFATDKGNCNKEYMQKFFFELPIKDRFDLEKNQMSLEDIVDAFWICKLLHQEIRLKLGVDKITELKTKRLQNIFTRKIGKTKSAKSILDSDYIYKRKSD